VRVPPQPGASQIRQWIAGQSGIEYAEPLYYHRVGDIPDDSQIPLQIGVLERLQMYPAWDIARETGRSRSPLSMAARSGGTKTSSRISGSIRRKT